MKKALFIVACLPLVACGEPVEGSLAFANQPVSVASLFESSEMVGSFELTDGCTYFVHTDGKDIAVFPKNRSSVESGDIVVDGRAFALGESSIVRAERVTVADQSKDWVTLPPSCALGDHAVIINSGDL